MFEIFGALFGGGYLLGKINSDKRKHKQAELEFNTVQSIQSVITNQSVEAGLRNELYYALPNDVRNGSVELTTTQHQTICENVIHNRMKTIYQDIPSEDMKYIFGNDWEELFKEIPTDYNSLKDGKYNSLGIPIFGSIWEVVLNVRLSMLGYISNTHSLNGYQFKRPIKWVKDGQEQDVAIRACQIIERNIQGRHPDINGLALYVSTYPSDFGATLVWKYAKECIGERLW